MSEVQTFYRLIILYMLKTAQRPLSNTEITVFLLEHEYARYFSIQQALNELNESGFVTAITTPGNTEYHMTESGAYTLSAYEDELADAFKAQIRASFQEKQIRKQQELTALSAVYPKKEGFDVSCSILSKEVRMMDLMIHVSTKEQADAICANWNERHLDAYTSLIELLAE